MRYVGQGGIWYRLKEDIDNPFLIANLKQWFVTTEDMSEEELLLIALIAVDWDIGINGLKGGGG